MVKRNNLEDYEIEDEDVKVVRDGRRINVSQFLMDSSRRTDSNPPLRHRPGFAQMPTGDSERRTKLYADSDKKLSERYLNPPSAIVGDVSAPAKVPAAPVKAADREAMYARRDAALSERWRSPR